MGQELKVYQVNDMEWWVTDTLENLKTAYREQTGEEIDEYYLEECNLDNDGMYHDLNATPETEIMIKLLLKYVGNNKNHLTIELDGQTYRFAVGDGYAMYISFRRAIELDGEYKKPHPIAASEC